MKLEVDAENYYRMYDKIDEQEQMLIEARAKKRSIEADKVTGDNIYKILIYFDRLYDLMSEEERRKLMEALIQEIQIYPERQPNGQWLKSITFRLPIIDGEMKIPVNDGLEKNVHVETVCLLSKLNETHQHIEVTVDMDEMDVTAAENKATYEEIREWIQDKYGFHVANLNIAQVKRKHGFDLRENFNKPKSPDSRQPGCPENKVEAIEEALRYFQMI